MIPFESNFPDSLSQAADNHAPVVPPLNLQAVEAVYLARQDTEKARATLEASAANNASSRSFTLTLLGVTLGLFPLWFAIALAGCFGSFSIAYLLMTFLVFFVPIGGVKMLEAHRRLEAAQAASALSEANANWIVPCIYSLHSMDARQREIAASLLTRLLPAASPALLQSLTDPLRRALYSRLGLALHSYPEFALAILRAIERAEDMSAAPYLELAIPRFALTPRVREVRQAAIQCGEFLEAAETRERERLTALHNIPGGNQATTLSKEEQAEAARVQKLVDALEKEFKRRKPGMRAGFLAATWLIIFPYCLYQFAMVWQEGWFSDAAWFWGLATLACTQSHRMTLLGRQSDAARELASCDSIRAVGPLAEALDWPDEALHRVTSSALIRLLPRLKASDASLLNAKQRAVLYKTLRPMNASRQSRLLCAILAALEQVGDKSAIPAVSRLESMLAVTAGQRSVREAAKRCLPYLSANAENARSSQTLLRASSASEVASDTLLRPSSNQDTPPEQLLRASQAE